MVAHQQEDLLETFLMQEEKRLEPDYFGLKERTMMQGISVVRPLLTMRKAEIIRYLDEHQYRYFIDHTNLEDKYRRNQIRHNQVETMKSIVKVVSKFGKRRSLIHFKTTFRPKKTSHKSSTDRVRSNCDAERVFLYSF